MELTQSDYEERVARVAAGTGTDEDRRLLKLYGREGFTVQPDSTLAEDSGEDSGEDVDYSTLTVAELKAELDDRGLTYASSATRATLITALTDDDEQG